jgi:glycosyltransferase involved in cell wall biosynthesis
MAPLVSIIVNCFNDERYLERSVQSVRAQTFSDLECIIVDDGSTDNTRLVAEQLASSDPRIRYCYKENGGLASARNFGVEQARGEWIGCLDADDWIHEDKIRFQLEHLKEFEEKDVIFYCDYERVFIDRDETIVERQPNRIGALTTDQLIKRLLIPDFLANSSHPALQQCLLMKKSIFKRKRFKENLGAMVDRYFALEVLVAGVNFIYTPIIGAFYTKHQSNMTNSWDTLSSSYTEFYESIFREYYGLYHLCDRSLAFLINEALLEKDKDNFERLATIARFPVYLLDGKIKINNFTSLKIAYWLRTVLPNFFWHERYRGPRSRKLIALFRRSSASGV